MTDRRNIGLHPVADGVRDNVSRSRNSKVSKMKTKRRLIGLNDSQSPSCNNSYNCRKDYTTPKRRPRIRFNSCYSGDSPNEAESLQDIIWDPNSPTQNFNGKGVNGKVIEISEIVKRIAPKVERPNEGDSVLQWIGDNVIPCTPEIRQPKIRRISSRQSNVEDLMKLAKQFDINMTRMTTEKLNKPQRDDTQRVKPASTSVTSEGIADRIFQARQEEEELQALFDGPTQHLSGRLSPPSAHCTPESITAPGAPAGPGLSSAPIKKAPENTPKATDVDFDDDWENDDLLNDSFVLEMTQNPVPLNIAQKKPESSSVAKTHLSVSHIRDVCLQNQKSTGKSCTVAKGQTSVQGTSRVKSHAQTTEKLLKTLIQKQPAQSSHANKQTELHRATKGEDGSGQPSTSNFKGVSKEDLKSLFDSDALWNDEDDDLLWQACDDVEKTSASQEQHKQHSMNFTELAHNTSKATSSAEFTHAQAVNITKKSLSGETTKSTRAFARSNSVPSSSSVFKQDYNVTNPETAEYPTGSRSNQYRQAQNKLTEVKSALQPRTNDTSLTTIPQNTRKPNPSNAHHGTFKRHLSDSVTLTNKVFVSSNTTVKCSAAEIERKKQEAIARRKLRMQASQKQGAPK